MPLELSKRKIIRGGNLVSITLKEAYTKIFMFSFWAFFWLLIFDGAIRKWFFMDHASILLFARDPFVIIMYLMALLLGVFPFNGFVVSTIILGFLCVLGSLFSEWQNLIFTLYGLRVYFFYLPLIFVLPKILKRSDIDKLGKAFMFTAMGMLILVFIQFQSNAYSFINKAILEGDKHLPSALGKIRPSGTFSFVTGLCEFSSVAVAYIIYGILEMKYKPVFLSAAAISLGGIVAFSGSRTMILFMIFLAILAFSASRLEKMVQERFKKLVLISSVVFLVLFSVPDTNYGIEVITSRFIKASQSESQEQGVFSRYFRSWYVFTMNMNDIFPFGKGLGMGTAAATKVVAGEHDNMLAEEEWPKVLLENGIILGILYLLLRFSIAFYLLRESIRDARKRNILPLLLMGLAVPLLVNAQLGQSTSLGFTILSSGVALAAAGEEEN